MAVSVDVFVSTDEVVPAPVVGAVVGVFDPVTFAPVASAVTNGLGKASFLLTGSASPGTPYEVRVFKLGVLFLNPFGIEVVDPPLTTNKFDVAGTPTTLTPATDPRVCRCTGRFVDLGNKPLPNKMVRVSATVEFQVPKVVDGNVVAAEEREFRTDENGYVSADLIRGAAYRVSLAESEFDSWEIVVPDRTSVNLIDLIHPAPVSLDWEDAVAPLNVVTVAVGETKEVQMTLLLSDFQELTDSRVTDYVVLDNSDSAVALAETSDGKLFVTGVSAGTATVTGTVVDGLSPARVPGYSVTVPSLTVTVT